MAKKKVYKSKKISGARGKKRSWRILKTRINLKRKLRILGLAFLVFVSTLVVFAAVALYSFYRTPLAAAAGSFLPARVWKGEGRENLLLVLLSDLNDPAALVEDLVVLSLDPWGKSLAIVSLPVEAEVEIPRGFGRGKLSAVYALGGFAKPKQNVSVLTRTVSNLLAVPIDGYLLLDDRGFSELRTIVGGPPTVKNLKEVVSPLGLFRWPKLVSFLGKNLRTDLSLGELLKVRRFFLSIRFDKVGEVSLGRGDLADRWLLSRLAERHFLDQKAREENLRVLVLNGTEVSGLAAKAAVFVRNLGAGVLDVDNAPRQDYGKSFIIVKEGSPYTAERLGEVFSIQTFRPLGDFKEEPFFGLFRRADLVVILGLDKASEL